jgi:Leucine-rich repeat (LRR) protein
LEVRKTCFSPCNHQRIPDEIECLASSLTVLSIYDTKITHLPRRIGKLRHLQTLILSNIGLTNLPDSIGDLSSLKTLYLANNNLISLPSTINNLRSLTDINLTNNPYLHSIQPLNGLPSLRSLDARHCSIKDLPRDLPQLIDVLMTNNNLTRLVDIETLGSGTNNTKSFHFDKNRIQFISPNIRAVKNLFRLNLNNNQLKTLPSDIFNIPTLRDLYVNNNPLNGDDLKRVNAKFNISYKSRPKPSKQKIQ